MGISTGVWFGDVHSYHDLNLILAPFTMPPAVAKTEFLEIAGGDGALDLTEKHGKVYYNDRNPQFTFTVNPSDKMSFDEKATQVSNALNGKRCKIILDRDPEYYYDARISVSEYMQNKRIGQIVITAVTRPFKMRVNETVRKYNLTTTAKTVKLSNGKKEVTPVFEVSDTVKIGFNGAEFNLSAGTHEVPDIYLAEGGAELDISGAGTLKVTYREGEL